jgi:hypothetical protein
MQPILINGMELSKAKICIISCGVNGWYAKGVERLERSLNFVGFPGDIITWKDTYPPGSHPHEEVPYYFKIAAFEWALYRGYTHIVWCDSSFWSIRNPMPLFDLINDQGYYMFSTGYNLAQTTNDNTLFSLGLSRDEIEPHTEWATGCVGLNFENPTARNLYKLWKEYMDKGLSKGSRLHDGQSSDPRFLFHRQDQSMFGLACYQLKLRNERGLDYVTYYGTNYSPDEVIFFIQGL